MCFEYKIVSVPYFLDLMCYYELAECLDNLGYCDRNAWEQTRIVAYYIALKMCKKKLNIKDIIPLPFDKKVDKEYNIEKIEELAKQIENFLNNGEQTINGINP